MWEEVRIRPLAAANIVYLQVCVFQGSGGPAEEKRPRKNISTNLYGSSGGTQPLGEVSGMRCELAEAGLPLTAWNPQPRSNQPAGSSTAGHRPGREGAGVTLGGCHSFLELGGGLVLHKPHAWDPRTAVSREHSGNCPQEERTAGPSHKLSSPATANYSKRPAGAARPQGQYDTLGGETYTHGSGPSIWAVA